MKEIRKIDVLGTTYTIIQASNIEQPKLVEGDGYTDYTTHEILIKDYDPDIRDVSAPDVYFDQVLRHEIIHAFLFESGLHTYSHDETIVDWIAYMLPALEKACQGINNMMRREE